MRFTNGFSPTGSVSPHTPRGFLHHPWLFSSSWDGLPQFHGTLPERLSMGGGKHSYPQRATNSVPKLLGTGSASLQNR